MRSQSQRYGAPHERPIFESKIGIDTFAKEVAGFFEFGLSEMAKKGIVPGGSDAKSVRKLGWSWKETRDAHDAVDWEGWGSEKS